MKGEIINCYHELLKFEREKLRKASDDFLAAERLKEKEVKSICKKFGVDLKDLLRERLLFKYPDGTFRTLHYDIVFRLVHIREREVGSRIPLECKIYQSIEFLPDFTERSIEGLDLPLEIKEMLSKSDKRTLSNFQFEYINAISKGKHKAYVISSPTATGKTLIFTVPMIKAALKGERTILIYPRKALASDQLAALLEFLASVNERLREEKKPPITVGIDDGDTPRNTNEIKYGTEFRGIACPICKRKKEDAKLVYSKVNGLPLVKCQRGHEFNFILLTKEQIWNNPPLVLITNGWTISRRLMEPQAQRLFKEPIRYVVLDEAHVYREEMGAHIHFVLKRMRKSLMKNTNSEPTIIVSSATLPKNTLLSFCSKLLDVRENEIFWEDYKKLISRGKEKIVIHLVLVPNPFYSAEVLAENVLLFLTEYSYFTGKKSIFFVDSTHEIHRLYHFVNVLIKRPVKDGITRALEHLKSIYNENEPYYWAHYSHSRVSEKDVHLIDKFSRSLGYHYAGLDKSKRFEIEEEFKKGLKKCLLSTSTLELGIDIGDVSVIAHYRYPLSSESYIQRVGRAGRSEESYYVTLSILILTNSPSQLKYVYGEETPSIFELPPDYIIPLPLENESIKETHEFLEVLDSLARFNRPTFIQHSDIQKFWRGKTYKEVILEIERLLKDGLSVEPDKKRLLQLYLEKLHHHRDIIELAGEEEIPLPLRFKEKLDWLKELEEWSTTKKEELDKTFGDFLPRRIREFLTEISTRTSILNKDIEDMYNHFKAGNRNSFERVGKRIESNSKDFKNLISKEIMSVERSLNEFWKELMDKGAPNSQRELIQELIGKLPGIKNRIENIEITYKELLGYFLDIKIEIESFLTKPTLCWKFNLIEALNLLGIPNYHMSLLFEKPLPKIYVNYPGLPRTAEEYMERTIDKLLRICTPFSVIPIQERNFFTIVYGLSEQRYKIIGSPGYRAFEGGEAFTFKHFNRRYTAWTPYFINMLNLNTNIIEALSDRPQNCKLVLSNMRKGSLHDIENCRFCLYGFMITSEQKEICTRTSRDCPLYGRGCRGTTWFIKPKPPYRTSYLGLVKVYPQVYTNAKKFEEEILNVPITKNLTIKFGKGSLFDKALIGCYLVSSGGMLSFLYPPMFTLTHNTLGYRISSNGIIVEFDKKVLKSMIKNILEKTPTLYSWIVVKYLISDKYFKEEGDINLARCQEAFEGLIDEESEYGTKGFKTELKKWLKKKEVNEELLDFATFVFLHSFSHLLYEYIVGELQTSPDNINYHIDKNECRVYLIENAEKGLGLTETLLSIIHGNEKEFFINFLRWSLKVIDECERRKIQLKESARKELSEKIRYLDDKGKARFQKIETFVKNVNQLFQKEYGIDFPIEILRNILVKRFGNDPLIMEAIISNVSYCWDGCYNCVRIEGCNYDPFKQMTRVSKTLFVEIARMILSELEIPVQVGSGFRWILDEIGKTRNILRISSPWISKDIIKEHIEPLLKKGVAVKIVTRKDLDNEEQIESLNHLTNLAKSYRNIKVKHLDSLHAKIVLIDNEVGIKGSMNLTFTGLFKNIEVVEKYVQKDIVEKLIDEFEKIFNMAEDL